LQHRPVCRDPFGQLFGSVDCLTHLSEKLGAARIGDPKVLLNPIPKALAMLAKRARRLGGGCGRSDDGEWRFAHDDLREKSSTKIPQQ
jgi:hypothetical protein